MNVCKHTIKTLAKVAPNLFLLQTKKMNFHAYLLWSNWVGKDKCLFDVKCSSKSKINC